MLDSYSSLLVMIYLFTNILFVWLYVLFLFDKIKSQKLKIQNSLKLIVRLSLSNCLTEMKIFLKNANHMQVFARHCSIGVIPTNMIMLSPSRGWILDKLFPQWQQEKEAILIPIRFKGGTQTGNLVMGVFGSPFFIVAHWSTIPCYMMISISFSYQYYSSCILCSFHSIPFITHYTIPNPFVTSSLPS